METWLKWAIGIGIYLVIGFIIFVASCVEDKINNKKADYIENINHIWGWFLLLICIIVLFIFEQFDKLLDVIAEKIIKHKESKKTKAVKANR